VQALAGERLPRGEDVQLAFDQGEGLRRWCKLGDIDFGEIAECYERLARASAPHPIDTAGIAADALEFGLYRERKLSRLEFHGIGSRRRRSSSFCRLAAGRRSLRRRRFIGRLCGGRRRGDRGSFTLFRRIRLSGRVSGRSLLRRSRLGDDLARLAF